MTRERTTTNLVYTPPESRHDHNGPHLVANWFVRSFAHPSSSCSFVLPFWMEFFLLPLLPLCFPPIFWDGRTDEQRFVRSFSAPSISLRSRSLSLPLVRSFVPPFADASLSIFSGCLGNWYSLFGYILGNVTYPSWARYYQYCL